MRALLLALSVLLLAACFATTWRWTSDLGRQCYFGCQARGDQCSSQCFGNLGCNISCGSMRRNCLRGCPDLTSE